MAKHQRMKQGEKILFGIAGVFIVLAIIAYVMLEVYRQGREEPLFGQTTRYELSADGQRGSVLFRKSGCTACHRAMRNGTNMGLSLDGVGSVRTQEWLFNFLRDPEQTYGSSTVDHGYSPKEAAYVSSMSKEDLSAIAEFIAGLKSEQGSASAPMPPEDRSEFIDNMLKNFAPPGWKDKYQDVREK